MLEKNDRSKILQCPFCGETPGIPIEIVTPFGDTIEGGNCRCGAVYVYDRTGRKLGEAYTEALVLAYGWDYDRAFAAPEGSYEEAVVRFNSRVRKFIVGEGDIKDRSAKFCFIKRKKAD